MSDIGSWLRRHGLGKYEQILAENEIDLEVLPELEEADLEKIGLALGPRKKLLKAIRELERSQDLASTPAPTLPPASSAEAERRQLTVMFADMVGSTGLSQTIDPEDLRDINRTYQTAVTAAIQRYGGYVARYMGDGVLAYFGYPLAHEDDAERALRAGLGIVHAVPKLDTGVVLAVRVGVATGTVVVGDIVGEGAAQESAVIGETPNLAARLQSIAEANTVVVSDATEHLVAGRFDLDSLGPQELKGMTQPVCAYRVRGLRAVSRFDAAHARRTTPLVGRDEELGMLLWRWQLAREAEGQVVLLCGEAGVGKSRIVRALEEAVAETSPHRVRYYCSPYHQSSVLHPVTEQLERAAGLRADQTPPDKLQALERLVRHADLDVAHAAPYFAELLSIPYSGAYPALEVTPEALRQRTLELLVETVVALAAQKPALVVVEDVHWIDPSTQDFLTRLVERVRSKRILIVVTHRPEYASPWSDYSHVTAITLNNLGRRDSAAMVAEMTTGRGLPESIVEEIVERSDGVPLFIEELAAAFGDIDIVAAGGEAAQSGAPGIPVTLQDLLMERLDRLGPAKEVAQHAAVIGRSFTFDLLLAVTRRDEATLSDALARLAAAGLVYGRGSVDSSYDFKHALVCDAAYQSLLRRDRQACHRRIAAALTDLGDDNPPLELIARHLEEGKRPDEAALYWRRAGERALGRFAHVEAIADFNRALAAIEASPDTGERSRFELETQTLLGPSLMYVMGQGAAEVERTYERALELADRLDDSQASFTAAWGLWRLQFARADMRAALRLASKCGQAVAASNDRVIRLGTAFALGATHLFSGDCSAAAPHLERSIGLYRAMPDKSVLAVFGQDPGLSSLAYLGWVRWTLGLPEQALVLSEEAVQLARDIGKPVLIAIATGFAGMTHSMRGDIPRLTECAEECLSICERHRFRQHAAMSNVMLAYAYSRRGDFARASAMAEQALDEKVALHSYIALPWFCYLAAEVYLAANRLDKALEATRKGIEFAARGGERFFESENHRMHARIVAEDPKASRSVAAGNFDRALRQAREQQAKSLELRAACSFARFAAAHGDADRARELLAPIYDSFTEGFETADLKEAADLLRELS